MELNGAHYQLAVVLFAGLLHQVDTHRSHHLWGSVAKLARRIHYTRPTTRQLLDVVEAKVTHARCSVFLHLVRQNNPVSSCSAVQQAKSRQRGALAVIFAENCEARSPDN